MATSYSATSGQQRSSMPQIGRKQPAVRSELPVQLMIEVGANPKDVQAKAHSRILDHIYAQHVPESQRRAVDRMMRR